MNDLKKRVPRYYRLLKFYPAAYRNRYGRAILQAAADMLDSAGNRWGRAAIWIRLCLDAPFSILFEQLIVTIGPEPYETPRYVKLGSVLSSLLLTPFVAAVAVNFADQVVV